MRTIILFFCLAATPLTAMACPPAPDHRLKTAEIIAALQNSSPQEAPAYSSALWLLWRDAPDAKAQAMLDLGIGFIGRQDFEQAKFVLTQLVEYCPEYAEGYNQRAFAAFLARDFEGALVDLDRAIALNPVHIAAISGKGLTLLGLGRDEEAYQTIRDALQLNPWLSERRFLPKDDSTDI